VADIFRAHGPAYAADHWLTQLQRKALRDAQLCRTPALGGHLHECRGCGHEHPAYNSCRNRHCPSCQAMRQAVWVQQRIDRVLPSQHFHVVFTLPEPLRALARANPERIYGLLFTAARLTLATLAKQRLGATLGVTAVLHTWTREMHLHPHLHCVVTAGGLTADNARWVASNPRFLFPVRLMGSLFRGVFMRRLQRMRSAGQLELTGRAARLADPAALDRVFRQLHRQKWVVYAKRPFAGPQQVIQYLGQYTHRVAISDHRLVEVRSDRVRFRTRNGDHTEVTPAQFLARWLLHILPPGFHKIRHFGLYAPSNVQTRLPIAAKLLGAPRPQAPEVPQPMDWEALAERLLGRHPLTCPQCGNGPMRRTPLPRSRPSPRPAAIDSS